MRIIGIILIMISLIALGKDVPQHFTLENPPLGWTIADKGLYKGDVADANTLAILVAYREFNNPMEEVQMHKAIHKSVTAQYGKIKDIGPASVASHATERYEVTDLGGVIHRFYIVTQAPNKAWLLEVRGRQTQISSAEAEIGLILGKIKFK
jgi:hypothetical protein